jgi:chromosome partitioning protein
VSVIALANQKGGVGKSTTAVSVGAALALMGRRVLVIDLDPQANATSALGLPKTAIRSIYGALLRDEPISDAIVAAQPAGLFVVPSSADMAGAEVELVPVMAREFRLRASLATAPAFDHVLVDSPPSLGLLTINALAAADHVIVPVQCEYLALEGLAQLVSTIDAVRVRLNPKLSILAILLTMEDRRNRLSVQVADEVTRHFPDVVAQVRIPRSVRLAEAPSHGRPIALYDPSSRAAVSYSEFARELESRAHRRAPMAVAGVAS